MANEGMRFTSFYAQTVCGPSRGALMTGCYPIRFARQADPDSIHPPRLSGRLLPWSGRFPAEAGGADGGGCFSEGTAFLQDRNHSN